MSLTTIGTMKNLLTLLAFVLTFSCNTPTEKSESKEQPTQEIKPEQLSKPITEEKVVIPQFEKESLGSLIGTSWIYQPYPEHPNCVDTLRISDTDGFDYNCEIELKYDIKFKIQDDTLFTELYSILVVK